jgi:16S rRNA (adenine1518-N6/adenine1519-N6)-dimethyltransferase
MPSPRQTRTYLRNLFLEEGISPRHRYGQNFLIDINIHDLIIEAAEISQSDLVLEVGAGTGALTSKIAERGATVCAVEIDKKLAAIVRQVVGNYSGVDVFETDVLRGKNNLNAVVEEHLIEKMLTTPQHKFKLVANLPYAIAAPLVGNLVVHPTLRPDLMVITVQQEVADRMQAAPATSAYGALSVLIQAIGHIELIRVLPPSVFWPSPRVQSAVVRVKVDQDRVERILDLPWFHAVVRRVFLHRRKNLRTVLHMLWPDNLTKKGAEDLLGDLGLVPELRAEALTVDEFVDLAGAIKPHIPGTED